MTERNLTRVSYVLVQSHPRRGPLVSEPSRTIRELVARTGCGHTIVPCDGTGDGTRWRDVDGQVYKSRHSDVYLLAEACSDEDE